MMTLAEDTLGGYGLVGILVVVLLVLLVVYLVRRV